jgi:replicative DNA helicase
MTTDLSPEYATLGGLLLAPKTLREVDRWLRPEDFAGSAPRLTYSLILAMDAKKVPVDPVTVRAELGRQGLLRRDGYPTMELVRMVEAVPVPSNTAYYARLVLRESIARGVQTIGKRLVQLGSTPRDPTELFASVAEQMRALDGARRRWTLATGEQTPALEPSNSREPVVLAQALAELDLPWRRRDIAS